MKQEAISYIESLKNDILSISKYIYSNPEESYKEYKCCRYLAEFFSSKGFDVTRNFLDIDTAFYASIGKGYPKICFLCQYDAVPGQGHLTGHNAISAISAGAALGTAKAFSGREGTVIVLGCPGEYLGGAAVTMCRQGVFEDIDAVLMAHPDIFTSESGTSSAIIPLSIEYFENGSQLSFTNESGYSPMDAMILTFSIINSMGKSFKDSASVNGLISTDTDSPVLTPEKCTGKFYIRSKDTESAEKIEKKIKLIASTVSEILELDCSMPLYELPYKELITNRTLSRLFSHNLKEQGIIDIDGYININAGLSLGDISHICPAIHPYVSIVNSDSIEYGTKQFAEATISSYAEDIFIKCSKALACTAIDLFEKPDLLKEAKIELSRDIKKEL